MPPRKNPRISDNITFESDNEDLHDEIEQFHAEKNKIDAGSYRRAKKKTTEEVLNVEGDLSDEVESSGDETSEFDSEDEDAGISSNKWGRKRQEYYNTDYVDKDWGGMRDEEMEEAELEEQDALARQKELDKAAAEMMDFHVDDEMIAERQSDEQIEKDTPLEWTYTTVKKLNKATNKLIEEFSQRKDLMSVIIEPLQNVLHVLPEKAALRKQLQMVVDVYSKYLLNLAFLLKMKSASFEKQEIKEDELFSSHPVHQEYLRSKMMIKKVDSFLDKNSDALNQLISKIKDGNDFSDLTLEEYSKKKIAPVTVATDEVQDDEQDIDEEEEIDADGKRKAIGTIAKNSHSNKNKKKKDKHAKVANRRKYKEIKKKVRSQIGTIRKETEKYTGEARGIRASTIKSVKLIA